MGEEMRVLLVEPGERPRLVTIPHTLEEMQNLVGGDIEVVYPWEDPVGVVCDEEGLYKGYPLNRLLEDENGEPYDVLKGTFFICGLGEEDLASISDEMAEKYTQKFYYPELFMRTENDHVLWFRMKPGEQPRYIA